MAKQPTPPITLRDPETNKTADLGDDQGVRALLTAVVTRLAANDVWQHRLPKDSTERVAAQILRKVGGLGPALGVLKEAPSLHAVLEGTDLAEDIKEVPKPKRAERAVGLVGDEGLVRLLDDVAQALRELWPTFRDSIERSKGEEKKAATVTAEFNPETDAADAFIRVVAATRVTTKEITRTSKVRILASGKVQLELFAS